MKTTLRKIENNWLLLDDRNPVPIDDYYLDDCNNIRKSIMDDVDYWETRDDYFRILASNNKELDLPILIDFNGFDKELFTENEEIEVEIELEYKDGFGYWYDYTPLIAESLKNPFDLRPKIKDNKIKIIRIVNNDVYVIINKTFLLKRIDELGNEFKERTDEFEHDLLKSLLRDSLPLIPEIEKAFDVGKWAEQNSYLTPSGLNRKKEYISQLKLNI